MVVKVLYFRADWCGPCQQQGPVIDELKDHFSDIEEVDIQKIDVDENQETANDYNVRSIPKVVIESDGTVEQVFSGQTSVDALREEVQSHRELAE